MSELGNAAGASAGAVPIVLLVVLLVEYELLRFFPSATVKRRRRGLLVSILPLLGVFVLVAVVRIGHIASMHS